MRRAFGLTAMVLAGSMAGVPAVADEGYWSSILSDVFVGPAKKADFRWEGTLASGRTLEIKGVNGAIKAEPGSGDRVEVVAVRSGRRHDPSSVEIKVLEHDGGITVCALYPTPDGKSANECLPGRKGRMNVRNNDVNVHFTVKVPEGAHLVARTVNGSVAAAGLSGNVEATTVNGSVTVDTAGWAKAETVNGSIRASMGRADWPDDVAFETVNGSITLALPGDLRADLDAEVVNGSISTDFALEGRSATRRRLSGTIGGGGRKLGLETVNGSIAVSRASR